MEMAKQTITWVIFLMKDNENNWAYNKNITEFVLEYVCMCSYT